LHSVADIGGNVLVPRYPHAKQKGPASLQALDRLVAGARFVIGDGSESSSYRFENHDDVRFRHPKQSFAVLISLPQSGR
jgi:hypothetical protein